MTEETPVEEVKEEKQWQWTQEMYVELSERQTRIENLLTELKEKQTPPSVEAKTSESGSEVKVGEPESEVSQPPQPPTLEISEPPAPPTESRKRKSHKRTLKLRRGAK